MVVVLEVSSKGAGVNGAIEILRCDYHTRKINGATEILRCDYHTRKIY